MNIHDRSLLPSLFLCAALSLTTFSSSVHAMNMEMSDHLGDGTEMTPLLPGPGGTVAPHKSSKGWRYWAKWITFGAFGLACVGGVGAYYYLSGPSPDNPANISPIPSCHLNPNPYPLPFLSADLSCNAYNDSGFDNGPYILFLAVQLDFYEEEKIIYLCRGGRNEKFFPEEKNYFGDQGMITVFGPSNNAVLNECVEYLDTRSIPYRRLSAYYTRLITPESVYGKGPFFVQEGGPSFSALEAKKYLQQKFKGCEIEFVEDLPLRIQDPSGGGQKKKQPPKWQGRKRHD